MSTAADPGAARSPGDPRRPTRTGDVFAGWTGRRLDGEDEPPSPGWVPPHRGEDQPDGDWREAAGRHESSGPGWDPPHRDGRRLAGETGDGLGGRPHDEEERGERWNPPLWEDARPVDEDAGGPDGEPPGGEEQGARRRGRQPGGRGGRSRRVQGIRGSGSGQATPGGQEPQGPEAAREICLRLLAAAPRTRAQLATALHRRGIPDEVIAGVLDRFEDAGLIDDQTFAAAWVESRHAGRGLGRRALAYELRQRGVDEATIAEAVDGLTPDQEYATARALAARKLATMHRLDPRTRARRLAGMLARRGYGAGLTARVIREVLTEAREDEAGVDTADPGDLQAALDHLGEHEA